MTYEELKNLVLHHCHLYYDLSKPEISDTDFDALYDKLEAVEKSQGWVAYDSPTVKVGGISGKVQHPVQLYSLRKVYDPAEVDAEFSIKTPKIDGANLTLIYKRGKLKLALTRGDGVKGEDVTHLALTIKNVPKNINTQIERVIVTGECVTDAKVENFRNYVSGALGLKSVDEFKQRDILFIAHDYLDVELNYKVRMNILTTMGFFTVLDPEALRYPQDGVVYRIDSYKRSKELGYTAKYPKFAVALKQQGVLTAETTLKNIEWVVGRTGTVNPTGVVEPVVIEDAVISRVTLHNFGIIEEHKLGLGDKILIERAGGVIPKFIQVIERSKHPRLTVADIANQLGRAVKRDGPRLVVADEEVTNSAKIIEHFIKTLDIKGLGPANIQKMNITHPEQLYEQQDWLKLGANGVKIAEEIERSKTKPYETVLAALGIPGVGKSVAKLIVDKLPRFTDLKLIESTPIKGIGPATVASIMSWLQSNEEWVTKLPLQLYHNPSIDDIVVNGRKVCVTGKLDMTRGDITDILQSKGFVVSSTVTKDCYALITAGDTTSSKYVKATQLGIKIIDYWSNKKDVLQGNF